MLCHKIPILHLAAKKYSKQMVVARRSVSSLILVRANSERSE